MATLIPAIGSCISRMTGGEKRFAWRLEDKLEDDYLCWYDVSLGERTLTRMGVPFQWQQDQKQKFDPMANSVKLITLHSSKGLEFPLVCMPAIGGPAAEDQVLEGEARLLYVGMTRATEELVMTHHEESVLGENVRKAMGVLEMV